MGAPYQTANFSLYADPNGDILITDPVAAIASGARTTLADSENAADTLTLTDGRHAATIALLGNYMAGTFATAAGGNGGTLVSAAQAEQPLLAHPPHG
jgi:hypothetical protein